MGGEAGAIGDGDTGGGLGDCRGGAGTGVAWGAGSAPVVSVAGCGGVVSPKRLVNVTPFGPKGTAGAPLIDTNSPPASPARIDTAFAPVIRRVSPSV